ncbi:uncharacterized protein C16orf78 homolog [Pelobates fuscus]|uniref:uncharacterized protein C16orf78 homolog n=1 Tax=Pelobates fuscus TaxID=191477 RepID=UPI002FE4A203
MSNTGAGTSAISTAKTQLVYNARESVQEPGRAALLDTKCEEPLEFGKDDIASPTQQRSNPHLHTFFNSLQQPVKKINSTGTKKNKNCTPFTNATMVPSESGPLDDILKVISFVKATSSIHRNPSNVLKQPFLDNPELMALYKSLPWFQEGMSQQARKLEYEVIEQKLRELYIKAQEEEYSKRTSSLALPYSRPDAYLNCRYLHLSKNNIANLVQWCKDLNIATDIHPHMTMSEIDIKTVMSSGKNDSKPQ